MENALSSAEHRAVRNRESLAVSRVADLYAALPSLTGKIELEYEGEMRGADNVALELIRAAVGKIYSKYFSDQAAQPALQKVVQWFELGGELKLPSGASSADALAQFTRIEGLMAHIDRLGVSSKSEAALQAAAAEFILEGLWAHKRINRNEERGFHAERRRAPEAVEPAARPPRRQFN
jgi:magnesium chelatase subunit I